MKFKKFNEFQVPDSKHICIWLYVGMIESENSNKKKKLKAENFR